MKMKTVKKKKVNTAALTLTCGSYLTGTSWIGVPSRWSVSSFCSVSNSSTQTISSWLEVSMHWMLY